MTKKDRNSMLMLGVSLNSTTLEEVLAKIEANIKADKKTIIVTPNPEFLVHAAKNARFRAVLNRADISLPEGIGLVLAARFLNVSLKINRIAGSDLTKELLNLADHYRWSVGVTGARKGEAIEAQEQINRLQRRYPNINILNLDDGLEVKGLKLEIVLACQGMGKQEEWIEANLNRLNGIVYLGIGGSLDFLTGFSRRAPAWVRKSGWEWLWRGLQKPAHWKRIWRAVFEFSWLIIKQKFDKGA